MHKRKRAGIITMLAVVLELAYRLDLKSSALWDCGFKSRLPHQAAKNPNRLFLIGKGFGFFVFLAEEEFRAITPEEEKTTIGRMQNTVLWIPDISEASFWGDTDITLFLSEFTQGNSE